MTGFEPATPRPPDVCATRLRYIPNFRIVKIIKLTNLIADKLLKKKIFIGSIKT
jgi:hypothetical protein